MAGTSDSVLMIGWEYPPHNSGGLGVACEGMTHALALQNTEIYFTLPYQHSGSVAHMQVMGCFDPAWELAGEKPPFQAYSSTLSSFSKRPVDADELHALPQSELERRVEEYAAIVQQQAKQLKQDFSVIHAHDWMSLPAAAQVKKQTDKPLIAHIHSTEHDRIPSGYGSPYIIHTEAEGMHFADKVIAVSFYTKQLLINKYGVPAHKIEVVHNGVPDLAKPADPGTHHFASKRPVVVFMGRLTMQKGAEYFLSLAKRVQREMPEVLFVVAGHGDMYQELLLSTAAKGLSASVLFSGFVRDTQREKLLDRADVFVMPSLSEPFGLVALEAAQRHTPVIVSKNTGVAEVLPSALTIDFWDIDKMTRSLVELLHNKGYARQQAADQIADLQQVTWEKSAQKIKNVYRSAFLGS